MTNQLILFFSIVYFAVFCDLVAYGFLMLGLPFAVVALLGAFIVACEE